TDASDVLIAVSSGQVSISGTVLTINPDTILDPGKDYAIRIDAGAIHDKSGNAFGGITDDTTWNLRTIIPPAVTVHTATTTSSFADTWHIDANWDNGSGRVPAGTTSVEVAVNNRVNAFSGSTPPYTGDLLLRTGSTLKIFGNPADINALGGGTVRMENGSYLRFRGTQTRTVNHPIQLLGPAGIGTGESNAGSVIATFAMPIEGAFQLDLQGNKGSQNRLASTNSFDGVIMGTGPDKDWEVYADAQGSLGVGDVTVNSTVSLVINAANAMADSATLSLNGIKSIKVASKLLMNANDTVAALYIDGVQQPEGNYDTSSSWLTGTGVLTVGSAGGADTTRPTLSGSDIVDDRSGEPVITDSLVTYTVSFSEDMDESTVTAGDFGNAGTCAVTFGAITETAPGVFTVEVTPTTTGTLLLWVPAGSVLRDLAGNTVVTSSAILDDTTITVNPPPDITPPELVSLDPPDGASDVALWSNFSMTFDEDIKAGAGAITLRNLTDSTDTAIDVADASQVSISGPVMTIHPSAHLLPAKGYAIRVPEGAITDLEGNPYAGIADDTTWNFGTVPVEPVATFTGASKSNGDNWSVVTNWDPNGIPSTDTSIIIPAGKYVTADNSNPPAYLGNLSIGAGATLQCGYSAGSGYSYMNALGTAGSTTISMAEGSSIVLRGSYSPSIPKIELLGNVRITIGTSSSGSPTPTFASGINGPHTLTVTGKSGAAMNLSTVANSFSHIVFNPNSGSNFTINANVPGALGGDVTVLPTPSGNITANLVIGAPNAIADTATLTLNGPASPTKLKITAPDTVAKLIIDGVQQPGGTYGKYFSGAQYEVGWIDANSTYDFLTVTGTPSAYWDMN
ncbi:MAG TPA: Ig-like domain-containing protein, partial [Verrucomicrobiae bacterium]|nr:Ig-like domain-containing protein [Verrucomicrobiae bacterium]